jgi:hypothetical protein
MMLSALRFAPWAIAAAVAIIAGLLWWRLDAATERLGEMQQANRQLTTALEAKNAALNSRAKTDADVRALGPDDVLDRLR